MGEDEFYVWQKYRQKRGPLNDGMRLEWLHARLAYFVAKGPVQNPKFEDLLRYHESDPVEEKQPELSGEQLAAIFGARMKRNPNG
jgi:hypothetical protein